MGVEVLILTSAFISICTCISTFENEQQSAQLTLYLIKAPFNAFANRADPDQAALVRAAWSAYTLFAYGKMIYLILHKWIRQVISLLYVPTSKFIYIVIHSGWSLAWIFIMERVKSQLRRLVWAFTWGYDQGSKIALVRSYLRVPKAAGQVKILKFRVKIKFFPYMPIIFVMQGKCLFSDISRSDDNHIWWPDRMFIFEINNLLY